MPTIDDPTKTVIKRLFKTNGGKIWSATIAKVYRGDARGSRWEPFTKAGALLFLRDAQQGDNMFLRLLDIDYEQGEPPLTVWEHELWVGFEFSRLESYFYHFESDDCVYGIMFSDPREAADFAKNIHKRIDKIGRGKSGSSTVGPDSSETASIASGKSGRSSSSFMKSLFQPRSSSLGREEPGSPEASTSKMKTVVTEDDIGDPIGFRHLGHIGFDPESGTFDVKNIPPQWQKFLQASGVTKADLQNRETATFIAGFIDKAVAKVKPSGSAAGTPGRSVAAGAGQRKAPPPPPPKSYKAAPPPPPPAPAPVRTATPKVTSRVAPPAATTTARSKNVPAAPPFEDYLTFLQEQKSKRVEATGSAPSPASRVAQRPPPGPSLNDQLMAGIRTAGKASLKPVELPDPAELDTTLDVPTDGMAGLLAKALKSRQQAMAHSDSDDDGGDWS